MFDRTTTEAIGSSLRAGQYSLLIGAGVSLDSDNFQGKGLPSTDTFRSDLCRLKGARSSSSLQRVYSTLTPEQIKEHVIDRFRGCTPGPSLKPIKNFLWRRIFSLNIDDAIEAAYESGVTLQSLVPLHFTDEFVEHRELASVQLIHLHGWVREPDRGFVFSTSEYVRNIKSINPWMFVLSQFLPVDPFIIMGSSLDEVDLEYYLSHRSAVTARRDLGPSIFVEPSPDAVTERDCEKYSLQLFKGTAEEFFDFLNDNVPDRPTPFQLVPQQSRNLFPRGTDPALVASFSADFEVVGGAVRPNTGPSKFLFGHPPAWEDLAGHLDIGRSPTAKLIVDIERQFTAEATEQYLFLLLDVTGAGKTTVLRRVGYEFASRGVAVITCSSLSRLEPVSTSAALELIDGPLLILVDNFADQALAVAEIAHRIKKTDAIFLCSERKYRWEYLRSVFPVYSMRRIGEFDLTVVEAAQLIALYQRFGLVGSREAVTKPDLLAKGLAEDPIAFATCRILNDFRPIEHIIKSLWHATEIRDRLRYLAAALAQHCARSGVRYEILASISGRHGWHEQFSTDHPLPLEYVDGTHREYVAPMNSTLASAVLERTAKHANSDLFTVFVDLATGIAPRVNRGTIRRRSPEARLAGRLFDYDQVVKGFLGARALEFYERVQETWRWNSRFWEQVALLHLAKYHEAPESEGGKNALQQSLQHARHAVSIEVHPFSLTTLAKVLLAHIRRGGEDNEENFNEAFNCLATCIDRERSWARPTVHPFITLFRGTRTLIVSGNRPTGAQIYNIKEYAKEAKRLFRNDFAIDEALREIGGLIL